MIRERILLFARGRETPLLVFLYFCSCEPDEIRNGQFFHQFIHDEYSATNSAPVALQAST